MNDDIESIHDYLNNIIHDAIESSTKIKTKRINAKTLPKYLLDLIHERKKTKKIIDKKKNKDESLRKQYNFN